MAVKSSFRNMVLCLLTICFVCSALLAGVNVLTRGPIEKGRVAKVEKAVAAVLPQCNIVSERQEIEVDGVRYGYYAARQDADFVGCAIESSTRQHFRNTGTVPLGNPGPRREVHGPGLQLTVQGLGQFGQET